MHEECVAHTRHTHSRKGEAHTYMCIVHVHVSQTEMHVYMYMLPLAVLHVTLYGMVDMLGEVQIANRESIFASTEKNAIELHTCHRSDTRKLRTSEGAINF